MPRSYFEIDLSQVPAHELYGLSYNKRPVADYQAWAQKVRAVQEHVHQRGWSDAEFQGLAASQDAHEQELASTYDELYHPGPSRHGQIQVDWNGRRGYTVSDGHHRLAAAKAAGLTHVPAWASAPDEATLRSLEARGRPISAGETPRQVATGDQGPQQAIESGQTTPVWERQAPPREAGRNHRERW